jgi:hypothetical protein
MILPALRCSFVFGFMDLKNRIGCLFAGLLRFLNSYVCLPLCFIGFFGLVLIPAILRPVILGFLII